MDLQYKAELKDRELLVRLEQKGSKRVLYLDTLKAIAKESDREALALLVKIHLQTTRNRETLSFQRIIVPPDLAPEAIRLMRKTGRLFLEEPKPVEVVPVPEVERVEIVKPVLQVLPKLILKDTSGCFANLWMDYGIGLVEFNDFAPTVKGETRLKKEEKQWEKDLLEAGYQRKMVTDTHYYCPSDRVKETLELLLDVGWTIEDAKGLRVGKKQVEIREENGVIIVRGQVRGLVDRKLQMEGVWEGETLTLKRNQSASLVTLLDSNQVNWDGALKRLVEGLKNGASIERTPPALSFRGELLGYQQSGVDWMSFLYRWGFSGLLADEMGLGKTVQVLAFLSRIGTNLPVLVVAPTSLLFNWKAEIARFIPSHNNIRLISYADLRLNDYSSQEFEAIILDESNAIKTATTQTARAACKLKGRFKLCLSGTPMENRPDELWSQFRFLMPDLIDKKIDKQQIRPFILRRKKEEVQLDLPEKIEQIAWVEMSETQRELYDTYKRGLKLDGAGRMEILEAILRLRQICCDPRLLGAEAIGAKVEQLVSDVKEALDEKRKILIYSQFTSMLDLIRREFPEALYLDGSMSGEKRGHVVRQFQEDAGTSLFLLSLKAGGVGLNLTAADYVLLFDPWWNDAVERQAIDRAHRIGQKKTVIAKRYLTPNSIEEKMLQLKTQKLAAADQLLDFEGWTEADLLNLLS